MAKETIQLKTYNETWNTKVEKYTALDKDGKVVSFKLKNPQTHKSSHSLYQHPTFFQNLPIVIQDPHQVITNPQSNNPKAIMNRKKGTIKKYIRKGYVKELNLPFYTSLEEDETVVVVLYTNQKNIELTYYTQKT